MPQCSWSTPELCEQMSARTALFFIFGLWVVLATSVLVLGPIVRYYFWRSFALWSERWLGAIVDRWIRYEEYWNPDAPATSEDVQS